MNHTQTRCHWGTRNSLYIDYHDQEWGVPLHDDRRLFEFLILEGAQAGLSWITILKKRENYRRALDDFDPRLISRYSSSKIGLFASSCLADSTIFSAAVALAQ